LHVLSKFEHGSGSVIFSVYGSGLGSGSGLGHKKKPERLQERKKMPDCPSVREKKKLSGFGVKQPVLRRRS
jgi:hypothetical protein